MRKIYSLLAGALMLFSQSVSAQTISEENAVLQSEQYNMNLFRNYDFVNGTYNGNPFTNDAGETVSGDGCMTASPDASSLIVNSNQKTFQVTSPVEMTNFYIQGGTSAINLRAACGKDGLHNYGSGGRWAAIADMKAGQIIVLEHSEGTNDGKGNPTAIKPNVAANNGNTGWADVATDPLQVEDITDAIHDIQDLVDADGDGEPDMAHDTHHYWKVINDGFVFIDMERNTHVKALQIWINAEAAEAVSAPTMKMASVDGSSRGIDFKPGESTLNKACTSYYITEEDVDNGTEYPLYLKESEEVDHYEYSYQIGEEGDTIGVDSTAVYKLVLDQESIDAAGEYGEHPFNPEEGLTIGANQDVDCDGYVTIWAQTLSESGAFSSIVELKVSVGEITLNAPTLSLYKVDGLDRLYKIGWNNNTLCKETFQITVTYDEGYEQTFDENAGVGEIISFKENATVKVDAKGYLPGVAEFAADFAGMDVKRKSSEEGHDWDFVNISEEMYNQFYAKVAASYNETVIDAEKGDTTIVSHSVEEYEKAVEEENQEIIESWEMVPAYYGWWQTVSSNRTTLDVVSDTIYEGEIFDKNENGYGYVKEQTGIFDGLQISCPPNNKNNSCIFKYLDKADGNELGALGVYFMAKPTITFPREVAAAGEVVEIYYGQGGSNYTNTTTHALYTVPTDELLSVTLPGNGVHVFYIDVFTYDGLPEDNYDAAIESTTASAKVAAIYTLSGTRVASMQKGINLVKMSDGKVVKMFVK